MTAGTVRLSDIAIGAQSGFASGENDPDGVLQVRMNNVTTEGAWDWSKERRVPATRQRRETYALAPGDVLVNVTNSPNLVGKSATFPGRAEPVVFSNHFVRLRLDPARADPDYVRRWLNVQWQRHIFEGLCTQWVNQASVRKEDLLALRVPLPPLPEQRRIAAILDKADAVRRKRQQTLDLADQLLRSAFLDMFGDPIANPKGWPVRKLQDAFATDRPPTKCGPFGSALRKEEYVESGIPVLTMDNIPGDSFALEGCLFVSQKKWEALSQYDVQPGDIIISRAGTVGKMCVVPNLGVPAIISTNLIRLSLNPQILEPAYFVALMTYCRGRVGNLRAGADGAYSFMNTGILRDLHVPFPSQVTQAAWRRLLATTRNWASELLLNHTDLEKLSASLLQSAFRVGSW